MKEWIVTNGLGSYASLTTDHKNTRKFHGLLIASLRPPTQRWMFLSNLFETLVTKEATVQLQQTPSQFSFNHFPRITYTLPSCTLTKTVVMPHDQNTVLLRYDINTDKPVTLLLKPVINSRHFYDTTTPEAFSVDQHHYKNGITLTPSNIDKKLHITLPDATYQPHGVWIQTYYQKDHYRKESCIDFNYISGEFQKQITGSCSFDLLCTLEDEVALPDSLFINEQQRKNTLLTQADLPKECSPLVLSSDRFIVQKNSGKSIIAGYHWFADWGRDTLIALPGLALVPKRFGDAKQILHQFSSYRKQGLIPNAFMDRDSEPVYNTVDASLWFIDRVYQYMKYTNDMETLQKIWPALAEIIQYYTHGTLYDIHMDTDYLISHEKGLTWMDVKLDEYYPTPRAYKAVEIQALWYNALQIMSQFARILDKEDIYHELAVQVKDHFAKAYDQNYDVLDSKDCSIRPNQIFLVSLDFSMIPDSRKQQVVSTVQNHLLTPFGLRSLAPSDPNYKGTYLGPYNRDEAYHNGTVWAWLLGPFVTAYVKIHKHTASARNDAYEEFLQPMFQIFGDEWDGSIYEIFDGNPPFIPRGCISQAWSVAEILRCWVEDIKNIRPEYEDLFLHKIRV